MSEKCSVSKRGSLLECNRLFYYRDQINIICNVVAKDRTGDGFGKIDTFENFYTIRSEESDHMVVIDFCPFCGGDIGSHMHKKLEKENENG